MQEWPQVERCYRLFPRRQGEICREPTFDGAACIFRTGEECRDVFPYGNGAR
jgi:hypothetical protein